MNKFYITTAIDYVNDTIHIGHAFQKIAADVLARYYRIKLKEENVFFLTGTDQYGQKVQKAAEKAKVDTLEFVKKISHDDKKEQDSLNISYNRFIETTDEDHKKVVEEIWNRVFKKGDIYLSEYKGLYCQGCEAYYLKDDLVNGHCPLHPTDEIKEISEQNYFFKWTNYKDFLIEHIKSNPDFIYPKHRANEMLEFAKNIKDIPVSRQNFKWGIPVPNDKEQVIYVWFDALINYLTGVGFLENKNLFKKFWPADVHILGKDNLRWHSLLWPAMLKSAEIELPKTILVNGFLNLNGQKISKSLGNVVRPSDWTGKYGTDAVRYYLLRYAVLTEDSDVSEEKLKQAFNSDLANGLGNLISRVAKLCEKTSFGFKEEKKLEFDKLRHILACRGYQFHEALKIIRKKISDTDKAINNDQPWKIEEKEKLEEKLKCYVKSIVQIAYELSPFLPETSAKIQAQFLSGQISSAPSLFPRI